MLSRNDDTRGAYAHLEQSLMAPEGVLPTTTAIVSKLLIQNVPNDENKLLLRDFDCKHRGDGSLFLDRMKQQSNLLSEG